MTPAAYHARRLLSTLKRAGSLGLCAWQLTSGSGGLNCGEARALNGLIDSGRVAVFDSYRGDGKVVGKVYVHVATGQGGAS
jgi:hypothetical protein